MKDIKNRKIAICFFGLTRSLKKTIILLNKNIFEKLKENNFMYDIYLHTYKLKSLTNSRSGEKDCLLDNDEYKLLKTVEIMIEDQNEFDKTFNLKDYTKHGDPWYDKFQSLKFYTPAK